MELSRHRYLLLMPLTRQCPVCQTELVYANLPGYRRACREKSICRKCAASPAIVQKRLAEEQERRAAKSSDGNPLAGFFEKLGAGRSGSVGRN
jgi:hypothetical protein